jgi:hypothetical protein
VAQRKANGRVGRHRATGKGYVLRKLRYEALPGLWIPAVLYEPDNLGEKVPAVLNVNGHAATGKATPYKQIRCINQAKRGMLAMNLEWIGMGQLRGEGYSHNHLALLDLCGRSGVSVFYLAMARGLDVLLDHPHADLARTAVTGLSGGGWQTIILSSLDTRVRLAVPVAGHSSVRQRVPHRSSIGDLEQNPVDLVSIADYVHLNALLAPRPALMIYNAKDDCCFVADAVKSNTYDPVVPVYQQAGAADALEYYVNHDPGTHNYDLDNRQQFYRFIQKHFGSGQACGDAEIPSDDEVQTAEALHVPLPEGNATFFSLAAEAAKELPRRDPEATPAALRDRLKSILRFQKLAGSGVCSGAAETLAGRTVQRFRIQAGNEWCVPAVLVRGEKAERTTLLMSDSGFTACSGPIEELVAAGQQVIALDPVLIGHAKPDAGIAQDAMLLGTVGQRPLGIQVAQEQWPRNKCQESFVRSTRRAGSRQMTPDTYFLCSHDHVDDVADLGQEGIEPIQPELQRLVKQGFTELRLLDHVHEPAFQAAHVPADFVHHAADPADDGVRRLAADCNARSRSRQTGPGHCLWERGNRGYLRAWPPPADGA